MKVFLWECLHFYEVQRIETFPSVVNDHPERLIHNDLSAWVDPNSMGLSGQSDKEDAQTGHNIYIVCNV